MGARPVGPQGSPRLLPGMSVPNTTKIRGHASGPKQSASGSSRAQEAFQSFTASLGVCGGALCVLVVLFQVRALWWSDASCWSLQEKWARVGILRLPSGPLAVWTSGRYLPRGPRSGAWAPLLPPVFLVVLWVLFSEKLSALVSQRTPLGMAPSEF